MLRDRLRFLGFVDENGFTKTVDSMGYSVKDGSQIRTLFDGGSLAQATNWRGVRAAQAFRQDFSGFYNLGKRYYENKLNWTL